MRVLVRVVAALLLTEMLVTMYTHVQQYTRLVHSPTVSPRYFQSFLMDMFLSESFFMTFATAISKSSCVTWTRRSRNANMPASVQHAFSSAPEAPAPPQPVVWDVCPQRERICSNTSHCLCRRYLSVVRHSAL